MCYRNREQNSWQHLMINTYPEDCCTGKEIGSYCQGDGCKSGGLMHEEVETQDVYKIDRDTETCAQDGGHEELLCL